MKKLNLMIFMVVVMGLVVLMVKIPCIFAALQYQETYVSQTGTNKVLLVVNSAIYDAIYESALKQYIADLEAEDYSVILTKFINGSPQELKDYMKVISGLKGVVFISDLPVVEFEIDIDVTGGYAQFPTDLFYMDLDGTWADGDNDGIYDTHTGNIAPEIWLGRLVSSNLFSITSMDEAGCLRNYFAKNHSYRMGKLSIQQRALVYPDDTVSRWCSSTAGQLYKNKLLKIYDSVTLADDTITNASDYRSRLGQNYEWVHLNCHSSVALHSFEIKNVYDVVNYTDIDQIDPKVLFYILDTCLSCRYTATDYIGGHYIFAKTNGLVAIGHTKVSLNAHFAPCGSYDAGKLDFYPPLATVSRKSIGETYKNWLCNGISLEHYGFGPDAEFSGMTFLGDPTLTLDPPVASIDSIVTTGGKTTFIGSGKISNGSIVDYAWRSSKDGFLSDKSSFVISLFSIGDHTIYFKVKDDKGRWSSESERTINVEVAPLPGPIKIINSTGYSNRTVTLSLWAVDSGIWAQMQFSNDGLNWSAPASYSTATTWVLPFIGDVDGSGKIIAYDALLALKHSAKKITLIGEQFLRADVNQDGKVTSIDAEYILKLSVGKTREAIGLSAGVKYTVYAKFKDAAGNWSEPVVSDSISVIVDDKVPVIKHTTITSAPKNKDIVFSATVTDSLSGVESVTLYWKKMMYGWAWSDDIDIQMINQGNNVYIATLSGSQAEDRNIKYYLSAKDKAGNIARTQEYEIKR